jgi:hypothetical protein
MQSSSKIYMYFYKIGGLLPIVFLFLSWLLNTTVSTGTPEDVENQVSSLTLALVFLPLAIIFFLLWFKLGRKLNYLEMDEEKIIIFKDKTTYEYTWQQVESIRKIIFTIPVSYKIKIKGESEAYYFCSNPLLPAPFHIYDNTPLGNLIKRKTREIKNQKV